MLCSVRRLSRSLLLLALGAVAMVDAAAITNVPPGVLVWLQGYDGNPPTPPFRNEGTVKLECVDDAIPVGLNVLGDGMTNAPGGVLLVRKGAGGHRFYAGRLLNQGEVRLDFSAQFTGPNTFVDNRADLLVSPFAVAEVLGPDSTILQHSGRLECGYGVVLHRDAQLDYQGGVLEGEVRLHQSRLRVGPDATHPFDAQFYGEKNRFEGQLEPGQTLAVIATPDEGPAHLLLTNAPSLAGLLALTSSSGSTEAVVAAPDGLTVLADGELRAETGAGGGRRFLGNLVVLGTLTVEAPLEVVAAEGITNRGQITVSAQGRLRSEGAIRLEGGVVTLAGGKIESPASLELRGGVLTGPGTVAATVTNHTVATFRAPGQPLSVTGGWQQEPEGALEFVVSGATPPTVPVLQVDGEVALGGGFALRLVDAPPPTPGARYPLLAAGSLRGLLSHPDLPALPAGLAWDLVFERGTLSAVVRGEFPAPTLRLKTFADGRTLLSAGGVPALALAFESSPDLSVWSPFTPSDLEFIGTNWWWDGLPAPAPGRHSTFIRARVTP